MINLNISDNQAKIIQEALNLYFRILMGQFHEIEYFLRKEMVEPNISEEIIGDAIRQIKEEYFPELSEYGYYSIDSYQIPEKARIAVDIHDSIRHILTWKNKPEGGITVDFDKPYGFSRTEKLPEVSLND